MRFDRIHLEHFKCYEEVDVRLDAGVTVIHGLNGSGKSSLLEAAFFALYGSKALGPDRTLDDIVTIGAEETVVELWFTHAGRSYHLTRRLRVRDSGTQTVECVLEGPEGTFEGATEVRARVAALLRMDQEAFVNCAFVRQGEVNKLIDASPGERQDMIDELLQLGTLEEYRERASDARVGVGRVRDDKGGALAQLDEQIAEKEDKDLHERLNETESALADLEEQIENYESQRENAVETLEQAAEVLETYEEKREELETVQEDIADLREAITSTASEREELAEAIQEARSRKQEVAQRREKLLAASELEAEELAAADREPDATAREAVSAHLEEVEATLEARRERNEELIEEKSTHENAAETAREAATDLGDRADKKREEAATLASEVETETEALEDRRETLDEQAERIEALETAFADAPVDEGDAGDWYDEVAAELGEVREQVAELEATLESEREALEEAQALRDAGKCPTCGQDVEGAPHVDTIEEDEARIEELEAEVGELEAERDGLAERRERAKELRETEQQLGSLRDNRESLAQMLDEKEATVAEKAERVETLREEADELETEAAEKRAEAEEAEEAAADVREAIGEANSEQATLRERIDRLEALLDTWDDIEGIEDEIDHREERREQLAETNDERRERLAEKRERKETLAEALESASIEEAREEKERAEAYIAKVDEELESLRSRRTDLQSQVGAIRNEIEELETLQDRREALAATLERLDSLYAEGEQLEEMYGTLRAELRQRNVESLERMLNESFDLVYENDSYSHIELDGEYRLTVYQKDGEPLAPDQLSGGERALFNLSLRSAIYRLLAEGIEGAAPMPPLILDEPTVFLDSGHVSRLVDLVEHMRDIGVEQLLVVSHDEELVAAADDLLAVRKDATTNRSSVERVDQASPIPTVGDD